MDSTPEIKITPSSPSPSLESFETASPTYTEWELTPYQFTNPPLQAITSMGQDSGNSFNVIASIRLPQYHLLVDHTLGVAWKSFCNQRKHIGQMTPQQLIWAIKVIESHQSRHSQYSEDMQMVIQYLQEIVLAMSAGGLQISSDNPEESGKDLSSMLLEVAAPLEDSFVLANMTPRSLAEVPVSFLTPAAASTPVLIRTSTPTVGGSGNELVESLKSLQDMLVYWKKRQMRWIKINVEQLKAIEQMLTSTGTGEDQNEQRLSVTKSTGSNNPSKGRTGNDNSSNKIKRRSSLNCW